MGGMTDAQDPQRVALKYTGPNTVRLADSANANPQQITPGAVVVVDKWAADILTGPGGVWSEVAGEALDDALKAADLSTSGSADEKRARLAAHEYELAASRAAAAITTPTDEQE